MTRSLPLLCGAVWLAMVGQCFAQASGDPFREFTIPSAPSVTFESTPDAKGLPGKTTQRRTKWMMIEVPLDWRPLARQDDQGQPISDFVDELEMEVYVLLATPNPPAEAALLKGQVKLLSVQAQQRNTRAALFVSPRLLEQLFNGRVPASASSALLGRDAVGVVLKHKGQVVATYPSKEPFFWEDLSLAGLKSEQVLTLEKGLLPRWQTPFASSNWDYFEQEAITP